jgi:ABC-2 type transport system ATP-binding protein
MAASTMWIGFFPTRVIHESNLCGKRRQQRMDERSIEVLNLEKRYEETVAVDGVSFFVKRGEIFGLLGPNGAGKTTTLECVLGLRELDGGKIQLLGSERGHDDSQIRSRIGVQLQTTGLFNQLKVVEQLSMFAGLYPRSLPIETLIELVDLSEQAKVSTKSLSGGQKQRLAVALALINDPDLVFLDEPTTGLDPHARRRIWAVIEGLRRRGKSVFLTTHYMEEAEQICDWVAIMDRGQIVELGSPASLINNHFQETAIEFAALETVPTSLLNTLPGVGQTLSENGRVTLYSTDVPRTMSGIFRLGEQETIPFRDMTIRQATLEDVFLKLTGRRMKR